MNRIRLLSEQVANQIAAGEVVERPASVVKELVENALDAQAARIQVEVQAGGRSLIRVTDDGSGMNRDDALLCLERHATSKIQRAEDLSSIMSLGFRGEALPSIASVSRMSLTTRERENDSGAATQVIINGGKLTDVKAAGGPPGTSVEVRQLFFNLPARRKFLRSEETESAHIHHYLTLAALAYPEVAFNFTKDSRVVWQLPAIVCQNNSAARLAALRERMRALFGNEEHLLPLDLSVELAGSEDLSEPPKSSDIRPATTAIHVWGLIGQPGISRSTRQDQHLFVNRRPIENRGLNFALLEGYHTALMKGRYPICCLFLELDPASLDVNIHPAKREVKFHREKAVRQFVTQAVRETLLDFHRGSVDRSPALEAPVSHSIGQGQSGAIAPPATTPPRVVPVPLPAPLGGPPNSVAAPREFPQFTALTGAPLTAWVRTSQPISSPLAPRPDSTLPTAQAATTSPEAGPPETVVPAANFSSTSQPPPATEPTPLLKVPLRVLGVIGKLYVILESDRGLVLMDQHAAHERVLFEQMLHRLEQGPAPSQRLLLPETVELSVRDAHFLRGLMATLTRLGVGLSEFGERTFLLDALPPFVKVSDARRFVLALVDELKATGQEVNTLRLGEHTIAKTVCRHAVKANDPLAGPELENLLADLRHCSMPYTCPHGRPTLIEMNYRELEKKFGRVTG